VRKSFLLLFLLPLFCFAQKASFRLLKQETKLHGSIAYPLVICQNKTAEQRINATVESAIFENEEQKPLKQRLKELAESVYTIHHTVTLNRNGLLSFFVYVETCGAYCWSQELYFNFDLKSGKQIEWKELLLPSKQKFFAGQLSKRIATEWKQHVLALKQDLLTKEKDSAAFAIVEEEMAGCRSEIAPYSYSLYADKILFVTGCRFRKVLMVYQPNNQFEYALKKMAPYLKPGYRSRIKNG
jgi:hypothetical protein